MKKLTVTTLVALFTLGSMSMAFAGNKHAKHVKPEKPAATQTQPAAKK